MVAAYVRPIWSHPRRRPQHGGGAGASAKSSLLIRRAWGAAGAHLCCPADFTGPAGCNHYNCNRKWFQNLCLNVSTTTRSTKQHNINNVNTLAMRTFRRRPREPPPQPPAEKVLVASASQPMITCVCEQAVTLSLFRGNHLSNTTCLTHVLFKQQL